MFNTTYGLHHTTLNNYSETLFDMYEQPTQILKINRIKGNTWYIQLFLLYL